MQTNYLCQSIAQLIINILVLKRMDLFSNENSNLYFSKANMQEHEVKDIVAGATFKYYSILNQIQVELSRVNGENS